MPPLDAGRARRAAGLALAAIVLRHAAQYAARQGLRTQPRVAVAVTALDVVTSTVLVVRRNRAAKARIQAAPASEAEST